MNYSQIRLDLPLLETRPLLAEEKTKLAGEAAAFAKIRGAWLVLRLTAAAGVVAVLWATGKSNLTPPIALFLLSVFMGWMTGHLVMLDRRERERAVKQDLFSGKVSVFAGDNPRGLHRLEISANSGRVLAVNGKTYPGCRYVTEFRPPGSSAVDPRAVEKVYTSYLLTHRELLLAGAQIRPLDYAETAKLLKMAHRGVVQSVVFGAATTGLVLLAALTFSGTRSDRGLDAQLGRGMFLVLACGAGSVFFRLGWRTVRLMMDAARAEVSSACLPDGGKLEVLPKSGITWEVASTAGRMGVT